MAAIILPARRGASLTCIALAALLASRVSVLPAQQATLPVQVLDSVSGTAVNGASVSGIGRDGAVLGRALSRPDGSASLKISDVPSAIRVLRIGFRPAIVALTDADRRSGSPIVVRLARLPMQLTGVRTTATRSDCPSGSSAELGAKLWEQARAGFDAVLAARAANPAHVTLLRFDRTIAIQGGKIEHQSVARIDTTSAKPFFAARSAAAFHHAGFVDDDANGRVYYAPDADALMDTSFTATHCFAAVGADDAHRAMRGISFRPVHEVDGHADITGTMWLDSATLEPRQLEFKYTDLEPSVSNAGAGGEISFQETGRGIWFIDRWSIRLIAPGETERAQRRRLAMDGPLSRRHDVDMAVVSIHDVGGEVARARWPDGYIWRDSLGRVTGTVSRNGVPVRGARVWLENTDYAGSTDSAGVFAIDDLLPGPYGVVAADSIFGPFGVAQQEPASIDARRDTTVETHLSLSDADRALDRLCGNQRHRSGSVAVLGIVMQPGQADQTAHVKAVWPPDGASQPGTPSGLISGTTDSDGRFTMCGLPADTRVSFRYSVRGQPPLDTIATFPSGRPLAVLVLRVAK